MDYITCENRKNSPKINVLVCEKKCQEAKTCKAYLNYLQIQSVNTALNGSHREGKDLPAADQLPENTSPLRAGK
jgi:ABC-type metal ion transport system substrate-binding protein